MGYFLSSRDLAVDQVSRVLHTYPKGREFNDRSVPTAYSRYAIEVRVLSFGSPSSVTAYKAPRLGSMTCRCLASYEHGKYRNALIMWQLKKSRRTFSRTNGEASSVVSHAEKGEEILRVLQILYAKSGDSPYSVCSLGWATFGVGGD